VGADLIAALQSVPSIESAEGDKSMLRGGCLCGRIRYEVTGEPFHQTSCHCSMCRRAAGAPFVSWFSVRPAELHFVTGQPARFRSSARATRSFCRDCGTQLTFQSDDLLDEIDITTCSLDNPDAEPPRDHTRVNSRLPWIRLCDGLAEYPEAR
jgi:hypothetical protein